MNLEVFLQEKKRQIDEALDRFLPKETDPPEILSRAMRYTLFAGGKRLRPILTLTSYEVCGGTDPDEVMPLACALELIHTFSLIHDDLPAMDDDDYRRGKPSSHKVFGEGMAILAGDALFAYAFDLAVRAPLPASVVLDALREILWASGREGMIGGQVEDLMAEGTEPTPEKVLRIHTRKTAALIRASMVVGGIAARSDPKTLEVLKEAGLAMGIAFQIVDDILDEVGEEKALGKRSHKDRARGKCTYPRVFGIERAKQDAMAYRDRAKSLLEQQFGTRAETLLALADFIVDRIY